jgi:hypothetical protein
MFPRSLGHLYLVPYVEIVGERIATGCVSPIVWHQWDIVEMIGVDCRHCEVVFRSFPIFILRGECRGYRKVFDSRGRVDFRSNSDPFEVGGVLDA